MNEVFPRCAVPGSSCRLLQLETVGARPVWAVLDAAGSRHFTGEITLHCQPAVRAWFNGGELYFAEREGDLGLAERLQAMNVLSADNLAAGSVRLGAVTHLGRLFDRVPHLDRDPVELALEIMTSEVVGEIADHVVDTISIASYRHHPSGVVKWQKRPAVPMAPLTDDIEVIPAAHSTVTAPVEATPCAVAQLETASDGPSIMSTSDDLAPTAEDEALVAEYEATLAAQIAPEPSLEQTDEQTDEHTDEPSLEQTDEHTDEHTDEPSLEQTDELLDTSVDADVDALMHSTLDTTSEQPVFDEMELHEVDHEVEQDGDSQDERAQDEPAQHEPAPEDEVPQDEVPHDEVPQDEVPHDEVVDSALLPDATPMEAAALDDVLALFERSFEQQFSHHFEQFEQFEQHISGQPAPELPAFELPAFELPALEAVDEFTDVAAEHSTDADDQAPHDASDGEADTDAELPWAIDDRLSWPQDAAGDDDGDPQAQASDGPVVEFDLQYLLSQSHSHHADDGHDHPHADDQSLQTPRSEDPHGSDGSEVDETDADIRAAVQAALAEIAAAARTGADHEMPPILMQAARMADADTGLVPSPDTWDAAPPVTPAAAPAAAPPPAPRPLLPARSLGSPSAAASAGAASTDGAAVDRAGDAVSAADPADGPPSQEIPATGGLRRLLGSKKS